MFGFINKVGMTKKNLILKVASLVFLAFLCLCSSACNEFDASGNGRRMGETTNMNGMITDCPEFSSDFPDPHDEDYDIESHRNELFVDSRDQLKDRSQPASLQKKQIAKQQEQADKLRFEQARLQAETEKLQAEQVQRLRAEELRLQAERNKLAAEKNKLEKMRLDQLRAERERLEVLKSDKEKQKAITKAEKQAKLEEQHALETSRRPAEEMREEAEKLRLQNHVKENAERERKLRESEARSLERSRQRIEREARERVEKEKMHGQQDAPSSG